MPKWLKTVANFIGGIGAKLIGKIGVKLEAKVGKDGEIDASIKFGKDEASSGRNTNGSGKGESTTDP